MEIKCFEIFKRKMWERLIDLFLSSKVMLNQQFLFKTHYTQISWKICMDILKLYRICYNYFLSSLPKERQVLFSMQLTFLFLFRCVRVRWESWILPSLMLLTRTFPRTPCCSASLTNHVMASSSTGCLAKTFLSISNHPTLARSMNLFTTFPWNFSRMVCHASFQFVCCCWFNNLTQKR